MKNIILISDTHFGCKLGLCPPIVQLDEGGIYQQSPLQMELWNMWNEFWDVWVPQVTKGEEYAVVHNGDVIDGMHHNATTQITHNIKDQRLIAESVLRKIIENPKCKAYFHIRGTEAHVGSSGADEETLARSLGAIPDANGNHARWELWLRLNKSLIHFTHHIGNTNSAAYESTAVYKELVEAYNEAGRWGDVPPSVVARSHRHRQMEIRIPTKEGYGIALVSPAWQLKTPFSYRMGLGRASTPQVGGYLIRCGDEDYIYTRFKVWKIERSAEVNIDSI